MKKIALFAIPALLLSSIAFAGTKEVKGDRECNTIEVSGSFFSGKTFRSSAFVSGVTVDVAVKRAAQSLTASGWKMSVADEKTGIISADTTASYGSGKTAPLGVTFVEASDGKLKVNMVYAISGGLGAKVEDVAKQFCVIVDAVEVK